MKMIAGAGLVIAGATVFAPVMVAAAGFTASGVAAGSLAAGIQSAFYGGATSGLFSLFQSIGATAVAPSLGASLSALGTMVAGMNLIGHPRRRDDDDDDVNSGDQDLAGNEQDGDDDDPPSTGLAPTDPAPLSPGTLPIALGTDESGPQSGTSPSQRVLVGPMHWGTNPTGSARTLILMTPNCDHSWTLFRGCRHVLPQLLRLSPQWVRACWCYSLSAKVWIVAPH
ncbi:hypothetical protein GALMADRAFT_904445 [Galerina marginata CBS 339.88]|uniref:Uncharacterized protein n=1 Tax=Galerina marginata (strain CBS 339.88) TaxID=685588 RepID=A0A067SGK1_GALM3|nr:hypothetical protein GALMADRAFT_904445 [Galerina marginata CBS 339.88]